MYDEFERALTGRPAKSGLSPFGWVLAGAGLLAAVGVVGAGVVAFDVAHRVERVQHRFERMHHRIGGVPTAVLGSMTARLARMPDLVSMDPERGVAMLADLDGSGDRSDLLRSLMGADVRLPDGSAHPDAPAAPDAPAGPDAPTGPAAPVAPTPSVAPAAPAAPNVPALAADGGSVHIRSDRGDVAIRLRRTDGAGFLTIDSDKGHVRFDLRGDDDGGRLDISTDDGQVAIALGHEADGRPGWVDHLYAVPSGADPVLSLSSDQAQMGAVAWKGDEAPGAVLVGAQSALEAQGYQVRVRDSFRQGDVEHAALWARNETDGRMVFVVAHREHRRTNVLLGYGEKR